MSALPFHSPPLASPRKRAVTWIRVSTAEQLEGSGFDRQREAVNRIVQQKSLEVVASFEVSDVSGAVVTQSAEGRKLIELISSGLVQVIVLSEMSRLCRPDSMDFELLAICQRHGVVLDCGGTEHDLQTAEGYLSGTLMGVLAGHDRLILLRRMLQSKEARRAQGKNPQADITLPLGIGYDRKAEKYFLTPEIVRVQEAFRLADEGLASLAEIGRRCSIHQANVRNILSNPVYRGERVYDEWRDQTRKGTKAGGKQGDRPKAKRPPDKVIRVRILPPEEQPVSDDRWHRVQAVLQDITENHRQFVADHWQTVLCTSFGRCGFCGERLYHKRKSKPKTPPKRKPRAADPVLGHYLCRSHHEAARKNPDNQPCKQGWVRSSDLDSLTEAFARAFLADTGFIESVLAHARAKAGNVVGFDIGDDLRRQLDENAKKDQRVLDGVEAGVLDLAEAKQRRERLKEERRRLLKSLESQQKPEATGELPGVAAQIAKGLAGWDALTDDKDRKALLASMFTEIYYQGASIVSFKLSASLVGTLDDAWSAVAAIPIPLPKPFRLHEPEVETEIPVGHRKCSRCKTVKPETAFYGPKRPACRQCCLEANKRGYERRRGKS